MEFSVQILGSSAAIPAYNRHPSAQVVTYYKQRFLIDCGECTQLRFNHFKIKRSRLDHIFISHLHGDHLFGLPGLITSLGHHNRSRPLYIYGPEGIRTFIETVLSISQARKKFELHITEIPTEVSEIIYENDHLTVETIPLKHRIPTAGYLFREKRVEQNIDPEVIKQYKLSIAEIRKIKKGDDLVRENLLVSNADLIVDRKRPRSYAYCSDTVYTDAFLPRIKGVTTLYHEATYLDDMKGEALERMHTTIGQAATLAARAEVGQLIVGHFSARYKELDVFLAQAKGIFQNTRLAVEGKVFSV